MLQFRELLLLYGVQPNLWIKGCVHLPRAFRRLPRGLAGINQAIHYMGLNSNNLCDFSLLY